eukprot:RCo042571
MARHFPLPPSLCYPLHNQKLYCYSSSMCTLKVYTRLLRKPETDPPPPPKPTKKGERFFLLFAFYFFPPNHLIVDGSGISEGCCAPSPLPHASLCTSLYSRVTLPRGV